MLRLTIEVTAGFPRDIRPTFAQRVTSVWALINPCETGLENRDARTREQDPERAGAASGAQATVSTIDMSYCFSPRRPEMNLEPRRP